MRRLGAPSRDTDDAAGYLVRMPRGRLYFELCVSLRRGPGEDPGHYGETGDTLSLGGYHQISWTKYQGEESLGCPVEATAPLTRTWINQR